MIRRWFRARALREAGAWKARLRGSEGDNPEVLLQFESWLNRAPENRRAWQHMETVWLAFDGMPEPAGTMTQPTRPAESYHWRWGLACLLLLAPILVLWGSWQWPDRALAIQYEARQLQPQGQQLPDGSWMELAPGSRLEWRESGHLRLSHLQRGEAFFRIAQDPHRPFHLDLGAGRVVEVLGTSFVVWLQDEALRLAVSTGQVALLIGDKRHELSAGEAIEWSAHGLGRLPEDHVQQLLSWREGRLIFEHQSLATIADMLGRYTGIEMIILDGALGRRSLSASVDYRDPRGAIEMLAAAADLRLSWLQRDRVILLPPLADG